MTNNSEDDTHHARSPNEYHDKALAIDPNDVNALYEKGRALSKEGLRSWEEAIECYDKVLAIDPNHEDASWQKNNTLARLDL